MPTLLDPLVLGDWRLPNRVVLAPLGPSTFYASGARCYTDYPALNDYVATVDEKRLAAA